MFRLVLEKAEEPEIKLPTSAGSAKKQESSRKATIFALLTMPKPLTMWITMYKIICKSYEWALFRRRPESILANPEWSVLSMIVS